MEIKTDHLCKGCSVQQEMNTGECPFSCSFFCARRRLGNALRNLGDKIKEEALIEFRQLKRWFTSSPSDISGPDRP